MRLPFLSPPIPALNTRDSSVSIVWAVMLAAVAVLGTGCASGNQDGQSTDVLPQDPDGNLTLYVSNQSLAITPVDITIYIDGKIAVTGDFDVKGKRTAQHNWIKHVFALPAGMHRLRAVSEKGQATLEKEFEIKENHWAVVDYWYYPESHDNPTPKHFTFKIQDRPIGFASRDTVATRLASAIVARPGGRDARPG